MGFRIYRSGNIYWVRTWWYQGGGAAMEPGSQPRHRCRTALGFRVWGLGFRIEGKAFRVKGLG
jgi:hypothetical protein